LTNQGWKKEKFWRASIWRKAEKLRDAGAWHRAAGDMMPSLKVWETTYTTWLTGSALPLWADQGVDRRHGGFQELLGQDGMPLPVARRARVQGRQSFVFAYAGTQGWQGPWTEAARSGLTWLDAHCRRADGLYSTLASTEGAVLDATAMTYDQAFAMLAASALHGHQAGVWKDHALALLGAVERTRRHPGGGFVEADGRFLSNPHMHLLEAALAWIEADGGKPWQDLADEIVALALKSFIDPDRRVLREFFDARWRPLAGDAGEVVEPGHQFEWAWLLERWARLRGDGAAHDAAQALFAAGVHGVDQARNVALDETDSAMKPRRATARLWPQTERLKAALILNDEAQAQAAAAGLWQYLQTPVPGLWRDKMREDGGFVEEAAPASSLYHIICAVASLKAYKE
jgi:mannose-1-phosphate guanylyltransferase/mannose-6-phosphate isomerase